MSFSKEIDKATDLRPDLTGIVTSYISDYDLWKEGDVEALRKRYPDFDEDLPEYLMATHLYEDFLYDATDNGDKEAIEKFQEPSTMMYGDFPLYKYYINRYIVSNNLLDRVDFLELPFLKEDVSDEMARKILEGKDADPFYILPFCYQLNDIKEAESLKGKIKRTYEYTISRSLTLAKSREAVNSILDGIEVSGGVLSLILRNKNNDIVRYLFDKYPELNIDDYEGSVDPDIWMKYRERIQLDSLLFSRPPSKKILEFLQKKKLDFRITGRFPLSKDLLKTKFLASSSKYLSTGDQKYLENSEELLHVLEEYWLDFDKIKEVIGYLYEELEEDPSHLEEYFEEMGNELRAYLHQFYPDLVEEE